MNSKMKKPELLAPAGSFEKAKIAFLYGADAVYCGTSSLSLRTRADMENEDLIKTISEPFRHVHAERGRALIAVWRMIPQLVSAPSDRLMSQPCEKVREGYLPHSVYIRPFHAAHQLMMNFIPMPHCV